MIDCFLKWIYNVYINKLSRRKTKMKENFKELRLNKEYIDRANAQSMFNAGSSLEKEAERIVTDFNEKLLSREFKQEQQEYAIKRQNDFVDLITTAYNDQINRRANNPSWAITGRANYNYRAAEKKTDAAMKKCGEYAEKIRKFIENTEKGLKGLLPAEDEIARWRQGKWGHGEAISADDPLAKEKLQAKLEFLEERQELMKQANAIARKEKKEKPYPSFSLTNNNATIKATKERLEALSKAQEKKDEIKPILSPTGVEIIQNADLNRLQIIFPDKPDEEMRSKLKASGFKWAPSQGAWQRQLTDNAVAAVKRIFN